MSASNEAKKFFILAAIPEGHYKCRKWWQLWKPFGYLTVRREDGRTKCMWTAFRDGTIAGFFPATEVWVNDDGKLTHYFEQIICMHLMWPRYRPSRDRKEDAIAEAQCMEKALARHVGKPLSNAQPTPKEEATGDRGEGGFVQK